MSNKNINEPVHAKRYKLVKKFKIWFFAENHILGVFIFSYCRKLINDVIKGNHYGDNIGCFYKVSMKNTSIECDIRL